MAKKRSTITVDGEEIAVLQNEGEDYISLTDMTRSFEGGSALIESWLRGTDTLLFLGAWERLNNEDFNSLEFEGIRNKSGHGSFYLSVKTWIARTGAIGIIANPGRYGGTFAHKDIAFEFGTWLSPEFKLFLIREFQRLKDDESRRLSLEWNLNRTLSKINYRIHTDAIKEHIIPAAVTSAQAGLIYANEADLLNVALFGLTAKQWRDANPGRSGNVRDYATIEQLLVLVNLEALNSEFIRIGMSPSDRLKRLNQTAISQLRSLAGDKRPKALASKIDAN
jgi:hypothetical protein